MPAVADPLVELLQRDPSPGIRVELGVAAQCLRHTLVIIVEDRWQRSEKMSGKNGAIGVREVAGELFDFSDGGHMGV